MACLPILKYGDERLRVVGDPITAWSSDLDTIVADMLETMYRARGLGLAATQVGIPIQLFVADLNGGRDPNGIMIITNPRVVSQSGAETIDEGCLSFPGIFAPVTRPYEVAIEGRTPSGETRQWTGTGLLARAFLHEIDHLKGILFIDRMTVFNRERTLRRVRRMKKAREWD